MRCMPGDPTHTAPTDDIAPARDIEDAKHFFLDSPVKLLNITNISENTDMK